MKAKEFKKQLHLSNDVDYGMYAPPTKAQEGLNILIKHLLGEDWYVVDSIGVEQVNSEAIYMILEKYPENVSFKKKLINFIEKF